ncbi:hypothetical protein LL973_24720, partial [Xanthomonas campestris pv. nigromaculans]|nr:hypothetical protein [Xanthomonas campestris pv. nigromaculans]
GLGLVMTTLIVTAPPMAAAFFQGTLGQFTAYSALGQLDRANQEPGAGRPYQPAAPGNDDVRSVDDQRRVSQVNTRSSGNETPTSTVSTGARGIASNNQNG